ncbi:MAG: polysaccharide pyruvyl transferase family protein [Pelagimonas sp.]|jgi:polysaccharide pyruvyl transferase WcaK-like protein|nr:polysaccharide pyruvyl transferase family protein [Pelagimonas sp.]
MPSNLSKQTGKTVLIGYAGKGNFGDDMMIEAVAQVCGPPTPAVVSGTTPLRALLRELIGARRIIVCGGHVINARTGSYIRTLALARLLGVQIIFFSIEASGWPPGRRGKWQRWIMSKAQISVRTEASKAILAEHLPNVPIRDVVDAFYLHESLRQQPSPGKMASLGGRFHFLSSPDAASADGRLVLLPRGFSDTGRYTERENIARFLDEVAVWQSQPRRPILLSPSADVDNIDALHQALLDAGHSVERQDVDVPLHLSPADHVISNRLHVAKACVYFSVPSTLISYDQKTETPELTGTVGEILQLEGQRVPVASIAKTWEQLDLQRAETIDILAKGIAT